MMVKRGEIYYADLSPVVGSEQGGLRPVLIVQNDVGNPHRRAGGSLWTDTGQHCPVGTNPYH